MKENISHPGLRSKAAMAATMVTVPMLANAQESASPKPKTEATLETKQFASRPAIKSAIKFADKFIKFGGSVTIAGSQKGHTIYKTGAGEYFWIDPATGDQKFLAPNVAQKMTAEATGKIKLAGEVTLIGEDAQGHVIHRNARGEEFYLSPTTGDMIMVPPKSEH